MINCNACSHKCHILRQAIPDHRLKSMSLLLHQSQAIKRELCLSGLIQLTGGDNNRKWMWLLTDNESYQYSLRLEYIWQRVCNQHLLLPLCSPPSVSKSKFMKPKFIFAQCFCLLHLGLWWLCHTADVGRILERDLREKKKKAHRVQFKVRITKPVGSHRHLSVDSVTQARTHYIHLTNKLQRTHAAAKKATHAQVRLWSHNRALLF